MIRKRRAFARPRKAYELSRIKEENKIVEKYGLKNKREIWKTLAKINYFRGRAKDLSKKSLEEQELFLGKLRAIGLNTNTLADVLALKVENLLDRRLSNVVFKKGIASTSKEARQMITHKRIIVDEQIVKSPGYIVYVNEENLIKLKNKISKEKKDE